jgi:hypothetical protein
VDSVTVRPTSEKCRWTAQSSVPWITITSGASVTGNGTVFYSVARNTGGTRTGTLTVAGKEVTVTQEGECGPGISGKWTGSGGFPGDEPWPVTATIQQQGEAVTGTFTVKLPCASPSFPFSGTFRNNELIFDFKLTWYDWDCKPICTNVEHGRMSLSGDQMTGQGTGVDCIGDEPYVTEYRLTRSCNESTTSGLSLLPR